LRHGTLAALVTRQNNQPSAISEPSSQSRIASIGHDELAVVLIGAGIDEARPSLDRLDEAVDKLEVRERRGYRISFSAGVVGADFVHHTDLAAILASADQLMYQVKRDRKMLRSA